MQKVDNVQLFSVIIHEYVEKITETYICLSYKIKTLQWQDLALQIKCITNIIGNTLKQNEYRENYVSVRKAAAFAATVGFHKKCCGVIYFDIPQNNKLYKCGFLILMCLECATTEKANQPDSYQALM